MLEQEWGFIQLTRTIQKAPDTGLHETGQAVGCRKDVRQKKNWEEIGSKVQLEWGFAAKDSRVAQI